MMRIFYWQPRRWLPLGLALMAVLIMAASFSLLWVGDWQAAVSEPYYSGDEQSDMISLAINVDWGNEYIPAMLELFRQEQIQITFFLTGRWCAENPELAAAIAEAGHEIGNHGYSHTSPNASSQQQVLEEILQTEAIIEQNCGGITKLYAPPSGEREDHVLAAAEEAGYSVVLWSVDTIDWQKPAADTIVERVLSKAAGGSIVLAHPTAGTVEALPRIIDSLQEEGYRIVPVSENLDL